MAEVAVSKAKARFARLLDRVEAGERIVITRRGKPVARPVRECPQPPRDRDAMRRAMDEIRRIRRRLTTGSMSIKDLINEGRR